MDYKIVYEVFSGALNKPVELVAVDSIGKIKRYVALSNDQVPPNPKHVKNLAGFPRRALVECFPINYMNPLRKSVNLYRNLSDADFQQKVNELRTITSEDIEQYRKQND